MEKCRICLNFRKRMQSLNDAIEEGLSITYAVMVASISNVKVSTNDGKPTEICLACCRKLHDIYEFRCQVEKSDIELLKTCGIKRLIFTDIQDIKCKIEITETTHSKDANIDNISEKFVKSCKKSINYNSTMITRLENHNNTDNQKSLSVKEFLESIKEDPDNEYDIVYDVSVDYDPESDEKDDEEYTPVKKYTYNKKTKSKKKDDIGNNICIKPVFLSHIRVQHTKNQLKKRKLKQSCERKKYVCPHCGKMVLRLETHELTHIGVRNFKCKLCTKSFFTKSILKSHQKCHAPFSYKCDKCVATFNQAEGLKSHQLVHTGNTKKFPCVICGKTFRSKYHVWRHCQGVHNMGTRKFSCDNCSMTFINKTNLIHHMRVHTGERPFKCEETRPILIAVICVGFVLILQALVPKAMALRNPGNVDRFMAEGHRTHKRKNYMMQSARDKEMGSMDNSIAYDVEPFDPDRNTEELSAFMVDYANMIRNDVILLDKSVETRTRKRGNIKVEKYNQIIPDAPCKCEPSVTREVLGDDVFPKEIEIRNCSSSQNSCIQPYACQDNVYNLTILKRRGLRPKDKTIHYNLRLNWYSVIMPISVGCTCSSDYINENNN